MVVVVLLTKAQESGCLREGFEELDHCVSLRGRAVIGQWAAVKEREGFLDEERKEDLSYIVMEISRNRGRALSSGGLRTGTLGPVYVAITPTRRMKQFQFGVSRLPGRNPRHVSQQHIMARGNGAHGGNRDTLDGVVYMYMKPI